LDLAGPPLGPEDRSRPILLLDATWKRVAPMVRDFAHIPPRSLPPLATAYPRVSKLVPDPVRGLASIEALIAARHVMGEDAADFWSRYPHAEIFRERNPEFFLRY
jgi:ribosome biogenesis protein Tsr3